MSLTDWSVVPGSVAGRYTGNFGGAEGFSGVFQYDSWVLNYNDPRIYFVVGGYCDAGDFDPANQRPQGFDPQGASYPLTVFTYSCQEAEGEPVTLIRLYGANFQTWHFQLSIDGGTTWTTMTSLATSEMIDWSTLEHVTHDGDDFYGVTLYYHNTQYNRIYRYGLYISTSDVIDNYGLMENAAARSQAYGLSSGAGGYGTGEMGVGTFDDSSDHIGVPDKPGVGVTDIGFVNVYNPAVGDLVDLGSDLFPDFQSTTPYTPSGSTVQDAIIDVAESLTNIASNIPNVIAMFSNRVLLDYIIDCHMIPVSPDVGATTAIKIGYRTMDQTAPKVTSDYVDFDCGTINIGEYYANFADYSPFTTMKLFLPFVGFVAIEPEFVQSGSLHVVYRFNIIDGSFIAYVLSSSSKSQLSDTVIAQYGGNACVHIPITGPNYANMVSGVVNAGIGAMTSISSGNAAGLVSSAMGAIQSGQLQASNGYNATTSFLSVRRPYVVISRSVSHFSEDYAKELGIPSNITTKFNRIKGYTESNSVVVSNLSATEEEKRMIAEALAGGVIF